VQLSSPSLVLKVHTTTVLVDFLDLLLAVAFGSAGARNASAPSKALLCQKFGHDFKKCGQTGFDIF